MEIKNVITIDNLTSDSVSVKTQRVLVEDSGVETALGMPTRKAYENSESGRLELAAEVFEQYFSGIIAVWGNTATVQNYDNETEETAENGKNNENMGD